MLGTSYLSPLAMSVPGRLPRPTRLATFGRDFAVVLAVMGLYFLARGQAPSRTDAAVALTMRLVRLEQALHLFVEPAIQDAALRLHWVTEAANATYAYLHFPVMAVVAVWLWWRRRERFVFVRNVLFVSMAIGVVFYYALPAAPPRLMALHGHDLGFTDTLFAGDTAVSYAQPSLILNEYAAIPSFHFGWIALSAAAVWTNTRSRALRAAAAVLTVLMTWAIVASANHLLVDMVIGGLVIMVSWAVAQRLTGKQPRQDGAMAAPVPAVTVIPRGRLAA